MNTILKWVATALFAGLAWLVAGYTSEYFRPYKRGKVYISIAGAPRARTMRR